jgi:hypothetical protein
MTSKTDFSPEDWTRILRAPYLAGMAISLADPGGPIEMGKETMATVKAATNPPSREQLLTDVALDLQAMVQQRKNPVSDFKPSGGTAFGQFLLDELRAVNGIVTAKATPEETMAFGSWLLTIAQASADAAKEGGFMGFHAVRVSEGEQKMLEQLRSTLGVP